MYVKPKHSMVGYSVCVCVCVLVYLFVCERTFLKVSLVIYCFSSLVHFFAVSKLKSVKQCFHGNTIESILIFCFKRRIRAYFPEMSYILCIQIYIYSNTCMSSSEIS